VAADVTDQADDVRQTVPMADQARANLDAAGVKTGIKAMLGDAGYYSETNAMDLEERGIEPCLATERLKHHGKVASALRGRIPQGLSAKQRMARKLRTKVGRAMYAKREGDDRADLRPVEAGAGVPAVLAARFGLDERRVATDGDGAQPVEAVAEWSGGGDGGVIPPRLPRDWLPATTMRRSEAIVSFRQA